MQEPRGERTVQGRATNTDGAVFQVIPKPAQGERLRISKASLVNSSATDVTGNWLSGSTVIWSHMLPNKGGNEPEWPDYLECNPGEALNFQTSAGVSTVTVSASGHIART